MIKIINGLFSIFKVLLLIVSFIFTFYIMMVMYQRLNKSYFDSLPVLVPFFVLLLLILLNYVLKQKQVTSNLFYNITCCLVFGMLIYVGYRAMFDEYLLMRYKTDSNIAFNYFSDMIAPMKAMLYLLIASNVCLMFSKKNKKVEVKSEVITERVVS